MTQEYSSFALTSDEVISLTQATDLASVLSTIVSNHLNVTITKPQMFETSSAVTVPSTMSVITYMFVAPNMYFIKFDPAKDGFDVVLADTYESTNVKLVGTSAVYTYTVANSEDTVVLTSHCKEFVKKLVDGFPGDVEDSSSKASVVGVFTTTIEQNIPALVSFMQQCTEVTPILSVTTVMKNTGDVQFQISYFGVIAGVNNTHNVISFDIQTGDTVMVSDVQVGDPVPTEVTTVAM